MNQDHTCGTCLYHRYDREGEDFVCTDPHSEYFGDWTPYGASCDGWTPRGGADD